MKIKLNPTKLFGSLISDNKDNYYRIDIKSETKNPKHKHVLQYATGCFFVVKTKTKNLKIKYTVHYRRTAQEYFPLKWGAEVIVFAKINDEWEILNHWQDTIKNAGELKVSYDDMAVEQEYELTFDLARVNAELFQICLPSQGKILDIEVESDTNIEQLYKPASLIIAGSSIAAGSACSSSHNLSAMAYRRYGINIINCGISGDHTFNCRELMAELKQQKLKILVMDLLHISEKTFLKYNKNKKFIYYIITPVAVQYERFDIMPYIQKENIANVSGEGHEDITHLNSAGTLYYLKQLKKKGII